jgi:hypothetical protein
MTTTDTSEADERFEEQKAVIASLERSGQFPSGRQDEVKQGALGTLDSVVPILRVEMRPTNVDPHTWQGVFNMKRVLNVVLNDESTKITVKDDYGKPIGAMTFRSIYPQVEGPYNDGSIQVEYHEQATLGFVGDVLWSFQWFFKRGILGLPAQMVSAVLQGCGVAFLLEEYYRKWLVSLLDQLNQQGMIPGFVDPETHQDNWEFVTYTAGRNIMVRPRIKPEGPKPH